MAEGFTGLWPRVGAIGGVPPPQGATVIQSSLSALFSPRPIASARLDVATPTGQASSVTWTNPASDIGFGYVLPFVGSIGGAFSPSVLIAATASVTWDTTAVRQAVHNVPNTLNVLWAGTTLQQATSFSFAPTGSLGFTSDVGAAFLFADTQNTMNPTGLAIAHADLISGSAAFAEWQPAQVPTETAFSVSAAGVLQLSSAFTSSSILSVPTVSNVTFVARAIHTSELSQSSALSATWDGLGDRTAGPLVVIAAATVGWQSLPSIFEPTAVAVDARSFALFDGQQLLTEGPLSIVARSGLAFRSTPDEVDDDDESEDDRRRIWAGAAEAEREALARSRIYDEEELALFSAALAGAYAQYRKGLQ